MRMLLGLVVASGSAFGQEIPAVVFDQEVVVDGSDYLVLDFEVPAGTAEVEVRHASVFDEDIIDFGVDDAVGFRGWGGGNTEPAIIGLRASSRSYRRGPIPAGRWHVNVGKAQLLSAAPAVHVEIFLRSAPTLPDDVNSAAYVPATLSSTARFYAGDLHVHSEDSGDARPSIDEIAVFAAGRGLDFVVLTNHNTDAHVQRITPAQAQHPRVLLVPGVEFTTYGGHGNGFGVTRYVDHQVGFTTTVDEAVSVIRAQGAVFTINHPVLDLGDVCIGCAWVNAIPTVFDGVEIATGGYSQSGFIFDDDARDFWDALLDDGRHLAPVGGSDDHSAGVNIGAFGSPIGDPTTLIFAENLSVEALLQGIRDSRTVVKLQGPGDAMIDLHTDPPRQGDSVTHDGDILLSATITAGVGQRARFMKEGFADGDDIDIDTDPFILSRTVQAPAQGEERWRVEVLLATHVQVVTGNVWLRRPTPAAEGCHCGSAPALLLGLGALCHRRRRRVWLALDQHRDAG